MPIVVFATNTQQKNTDVLDAIGAEHRLLSYWYLKDLHPEFLKYYTQGLPIPRRTERTNGKAAKRVRLLDPD